MYLALNSNCLSDHIFHTKTNVSSSIVNYSCGLRSDNFEIKLCVKYIFVHIYVKSDKW